MDQVSNNIVREDSRYNFRESANSIKFKGGKQLFHHQEAMKPVVCRMRADVKSQVDGVSVSVDTTRDAGSNDIQMERVGNMLIRNNDGNLRNADRIAEKNVNITRQIAKSLSGLKRKDNKRIVSILHASRKAIEEEKVRRDKIIDSSYSGLQRNLLSGSAIKQQLDSNFNIINNGEGGSNVGPFVSTSNQKKLLDVVKDKYGVDLGKIISNTKDTGFNFQNK